MSGGCELGSGGREEGVYVSRGIREGYEEKGVFILWVYFLSCLMGRFRITQLA